MYLLANFTEYCGVFYDVRFTHIYNIVFFRGFDLDTCDMHEKNFQLCETVCVVLHGLFFVRLPKYTKWTTPVMHKKGGGAPF